MKVVVNRCYGGFNLSEPVQKSYNTYKREMHCENDYSRANPALVRAVEEFGCKAASGFCANLEIEEIPDEYDFDIDDYDGMETVLLKVREDYLRKLLAAGDTEGVVNYVMHVS